MREGISPLRQGRSTGDGGLHQSRGFTAARLGRPKVAASTQATASIGVAEQLGMQESAKMADEILCSGVRDACLPRVFQRGKLAL